MSMFLKTTSFLCFFIDRALHILASATEKTGSSSTFLKTSSMAFISFGGSSMRRSSNCATRVSNFWGQSLFRMEQIVLTRTSTSSACIH